MLRVWTVAAVVLGLSTSAAFGQPGRGGPPGPRGGDGGEIEKLKAQVKELEAKLSKLESAQKPAEVKKPDGDAKKPSPPFGPPGFHGFGPRGFGRFDPAHEKEMRERFEKMRAEWDHRRGGDRPTPSTSTTSGSKTDEVAKRLDRLADEVAELKKLLRK